MMLNAMSPQRHHQQTVADSPLLLASNSPSIPNISSSPSSSSSVSSSSNCNSNKADKNASNIPDSSSTQKQSKSNMVVPNTAATTKIANSNNHGNDTGVLSSEQSNIHPSSNTSRHKVATNSYPNHHNHNYNHNNHHHQQQSHHFHNHSHHPENLHHFNTYQTPRFEPHHHHNHHHNSGYSSRSVNGNRGHNSHGDGHNHHHHHHHHNHSLHQHNHHPNHNSSANSNANKALNESVISASPPSWPAGKDVTAANTTPNSHQRHQTHTGPPHYVELHVNAGEYVSLQLLDGQEQVVAGPTTITMVSQQQNPPVPIPVQVPPGHMVHQIADENGTLRHIILSVMNGNDDGSQLDPTVITLPHGVFRVNSNGDLVSVDAGGDITDGTIGLSQQAYYASYDGCPVPYETTGDIRHHQQHYHAANMSSPPSYSSQSTIPENQGIVVLDSNIYQSNIYPGYATAPTFTTHLVSPPHNKSSGQGAHQHSRGSGHKNAPIDVDNAQRSNQAIVKDHQKHDNSVRGHSDRRGHLPLNSDKVSSDRHQTVGKVNVAKDISEAHIPYNSPGRQRPKASLTQVTRNSNSEASQERREKKSSAASPATTSTSARDPRNQRKPVIGDLCGSNPKEQSKGNSKGNQKDITVSSRDSSAARNAVKEGSSRNDGSETKPPLSHTHNDEKIVTNGDSVDHQESKDDNTGYTPMVIAPDHNPVEADNHQSNSSDESEEYIAPVTNNERRSSEDSESRSVKMKLKKNQNTAKNKTFPEVIHDTSTKSQLVNTKSDLNIKSRLASSPPIEGSSAIAASVTEIVEHERSSSNTKAPSSSSASKIENHSSRNAGLTSNRSSIVKNGSQKNKDKNLTPSSNGKKHILGNKSSNQRSSSTDTSNRIVSGSAQDCSILAHSSSAGRVNHRGENPSSLSSRASSHHHHSHNHQHNTGSHGVALAGRSITTRLFNQVKLCRVKSASMCGRFLQSFLSSNLKIASVAIVMFSCFSMVLALLIHVCILKPLTE